MSSEIWRDWLILWQAPGVGPKTWQRLMQRFGSPSAVLAARREDQQAAGLKAAACDWLHKPNLSIIELGLNWLENPNNHLIHAEHEYYPPRLANIADPPPLIFVTGDPSVLCRPQIAIVGTRNSSQDGCSTAWEFARVLAESGYTVTSGLAVGIDTAAHEGALATSTAASTIAVVATGLDRVYPSANLDLAHRIAAGSALVSELSPGTIVRKENFPRRNRIISGLSLGVLVVEAGRTSGALITARLAADQGREVFAIPGSIHNPLAKGCHALIRQGAKLVETAQDIVDELVPLTGSLVLPPAKTALKLPALPQKSLNLTALDPEQQVLLKCIGHNPIALDSVIQRSGLPAYQVSALLTTLEIEGYVVQDHGRWSVVSGTYT